MMFKLFEEGRVHAVDPLEDRVSTDPVLHILSVLAAVAHRAEKRCDELIRRREQALEIKVNEAWGRITTTSAAPESGR